MSNRWKRVLCASVVSVLLIACEPGRTQDDGGTWIPTVVARYPHDSNAFTQGLIFKNGYLYESTGRRGRSSLRKVELSTGRVAELLPVSPEYFAEGLTEFDGRLIQLTWERGVAFVYGLSDLSLQSEFRYSGEGWGLTHNGEHLIMSDGTATLKFLDPNDFSVVRSLTVRSDGRPVTYLNELEFIDGAVWANIWYDERIARIDPANGEVLGWIDLSALYPAAQRNADAVVNGIAYDQASDRIFVTGKLWPAIFEIRLDERD
jgi:glutaminyl-peptide cyclotransferase